MDIPFILVGARIFSLPAQCRRGQSRHGPSADALPGWDSCASLRYTPGVSRAYYPSLDGLRAFAILYVFGFHYLSPALAGHGFWGCGWVGVDFFFVLSGFLITGILIDGRDCAKQLKDFYARRVLRIFPLYYAVLLLALLYGLAVHTQFHLLQGLWLVDLGNYAAYLSRSHANPTMMTDIVLPRNLSIPPISTGHLWSLCIEEQFYLVWPFAVYRVRNNALLLKICGVVLVVAPLVRLALFWSAPAWMLRNSLIYRSLPTRMDALIMGAALCLLLRGAHRPWLLRYRTALLVAGFTPALVFFGYAMLRGRDTGFTRSNPWSAALLYTMVDLAAATLVLTLVDETSLLARLFRWRLLLWLGGISYGFYVFHELPRILLVWTAGRYRIAHPEMFVAGTGFAVTLGLAYGSFRFFESRFLRLKRFFP